jgi:hypothetical protein
LLGFLALVISVWFFLFGLLPGLGASMSVAEWLGIFSVAGFVLCKANN